MTGIFTMLTVLMAIIFVGGAQTDHNGQFELGAVFLAFCLGLLAAPKA